MLKLLDDFSYKLIMIENELGEFEIIDSPQKGILYTNSKLKLIPNDEILIKTSLSNKSLDNEILVDEIKINVNANFEKTNRDGHEFSSDGDCIEGEIDISFVKAIIEEVISQENNTKVTLKITETELDSYKYSDFLN